MNRPLFSTANRRPDWRVWSLVGAIGLAAAGLWDWSVQEPALRSVPLAIGGLAEAQTLTAEGDFPEPASPMAVPEEAPSPNSETDLGWLREVTDQWSDEAFRELAQQIWRRRPAASMPSEFLQRLAQLDVRLAWQCAPLFRPTDAEEAHAVFATLMASWKNPQPPDWSPLPPETASIAAGEWASRLVHEHQPIRAWAVIEHMPVHSPDRARALAIFNEVLSGPGADAFR